MLMYSILLWWMLNISFKIKVKTLFFLFVFSLQINAPAKAIFLVSNVLILACIPFRLTNDLKTEEAILVIAVPGSWFLLMFFAGWV